MDLVRSLGDRFRCRQPSRESSPTVQRAGHRCKRLDPAIRSPGHRPTWLDSPLDRSREVLRRRPDAASKASGRKDLGQRGASAAGSGFWVAANSTRLGNREAVAGPRASGSGTTASQTPGPPAPTSEFTMSSRSGSAAADFWVPRFQPDRKRRKTGTEGWAFPRVKDVVLGQTRPRQIPKYLLTMNSHARPVRAVFLRPIRGHWYRIFKQHIVMRAVDEQLDRMCKSRRLIA